MIDEASGGLGDAPTPAPGAPASTLGAWSVSALRSADTLAYTVRVSTIEPSYRYIVRTPEVRGGHARVDGTRIGVHDVIGLLQNGETIDSLIANGFPDLTRAQVYECLAYYEDHRGEIDVLVARQMSAGES